MSHSTVSSSSWKTWTLAIIMTIIITVMLLILAGVFHRKVSPETTAAPLASAEGLQTVAARIITQPRYEAAPGSVLNN